MINQRIKEIRKVINNKKLIIVSKNRSTDEIYEAYKHGHRDFGENRVQELIKKYEQLPKDIKWHMIGHLQKNKVKYIVPFIHLIHSVDSLELIRKINSVSEKNNIKTKCLIQIKIAEEDSKFGMTIDKYEEIKKHILNYPSINIVGLMGMATANVNKKQTKKEFDYLNEIFKKSLALKTLCMGMSQDYKIANECGSNMFRIGSFIFN